jgi:hypothetical protein
MKHVLTLAGKRAVPKAVQNFNVISPRFKLRAACERNETKMANFVQANRFHSPNNCKQGIETRLKFETIY